MNIKIIDHTQNLIETIYKAYRICYSKDVPTEIKIPITETSIGDIPNNDKMLEFIKKHSNHQSCLEHASFTFAVEGVSRCLSHQLVRHRLASYSQQSQRYVNGEYFDYVTPNSISSDNSYNVHIQDSLGGINVDMSYDDMMGTIFNMYNTLTEGGIPKEDSRYVLPNATTTNLIMTMNIRELINFFQERLCVHAQTEIREMAEEMRLQINKLLPLFNRKDIMKCGKTCFDCQKKGE